MPAPDDVLEALGNRFPRTVEELEALARIPGVSAAGYDPQEVARSAEAVAALLRDAGLEGVEILRVEKAHPYVTAHWRGAGPDAPTVLLYAHHDVQPPGRLDRWESPPFEPTLRSDGRLYARGIVDDKAGVMVQLAALRAWLDARGALPVNVVVLVEGEEEIGSGHLAEFLRVHRDRLAADVIVLSDTANLETGLPSITTSLRGLAILDVHVRALDHPLHSGLWGGPVPEAASALSVLLARLYDARGEVAVPGFRDGVPAATPDERARRSALPYDEAGFRRDAGLVGGARIAGDARDSIYERLWVLPSLSITALEAVPLAESANQLIAEASARVGVRVAPGQDPGVLAERVAGFLRRDPPWGVEVRVEIQTVAEGWQTRTEHPAFDAARRALRAGFDRDPVYIGCGGTIPFVGPFAQVLGGAPALLLGLEDPICNAHGENESLHLGDFRKAAESTAHLLAELARLGRV
jgi:acetylornithine deacetylase/succinyl-diaminopimelate desuccinylase-like protein